MELFQVPYSGVNCREQASTSSASLEKKNCESLFSCKAHENGLNIVAGVEVFECLFKKKLLKSLILMFCITYVSLITMN